MHKGRYYPWFQALTGGLGTHPVHKGGHHSYRALSTHCGLGTVRDMTLFNPRKNVRFSISILKALKLGGHKIHLIWPSSRS